MSTLAVYEDYESLFNSNYIIMRKLKDIADKYNVRSELCRFNTIKGPEIIKDRIICSALDVGSPKTL